MPKVERSSDVVEIHWERVVLFGIPGLIGIGFSTVLLAYRGGGMFVPLALIILALSLGAIGFAVREIVQARKVTGVVIHCPICEAANAFTEFPGEDFRCIGCNRLVPIKDGEVMKVHQVRCGACNGLNYYSEKNDVLLCEQCNREVPIFQEEGRPTRSIPKGFAVKDDEGLYELVLKTGGKGSEDLIEALQHMLALPRNQIKQLLNETPVTLLTGITRMKADILQAQIEQHGGGAEVRPLTTA